MDIRTLIADCLNDYEAELERKNRAKKRAARLAAQRAEYAAIKRKLERAGGVMTHETGELTQRLWQLEEALGMTVCPN